MLKANASIKQMAREIKDFLSHFIHVDHLILFGSYVYGSPRKDSDFDIAVISEDFEKMSVLKKMNILAKVAVVIDSRIEMIGFSKKDFLRPEKPSLLEHIKRKGKFLLS